MFFWRVWQYVYVWWEDLFESLSGGKMDDLGYWLPKGELKIALFDSHTPYNMLYWG